MIKCKNGKTKLNGTLPELMSDLTVIVSALKDAMSKQGIPEEVAMSVMDNAYRRGKMTSEEILEEAKLVVGKLFDINSEKGEEA